MMSSLDDYRYERMSQEHLQQVVAVHEVCFPGYYLTDLGPSFLRAMYSWYVQSPEAIAHAALDRDGYVVGFVAGTADDSNYRRSLFRKTWWRMAVALGKRFVSRPALTLGLIGERKESVWQALTAILTRRTGKCARADAIFEQEPPTASLISIGVEPSMRRLGIGRRLSETFLQEAGRTGCEAVALSVREDNEAARRFYESLGWTEASRSPRAYHGSVSITYHKTTRG